MASILEAYQNEKLKEIRKKADYLGKPAWLGHRCKLMISRAVRSFDQDVVQTAIQRADREVYNIKFKAYHTDDYELVQLGRIVYMVSFDTTIAEASERVEIPKPRGEVKFSGTTVMAKIGCTSVSDSPKRFKQLVKGNRGYSQAAAGSRITVEFTAEGCPQYDTPYTLEAKVLKAMATYYLGASFSGSELKELFFSPGQIIDKSPLANLFLKETMEYKGHIWTHAFAKCARELLASRAPQPTLSAPSPTQPVQEPTPSAPTPMQAIDNDGSTSSEASQDSHPVSGQEAPYELLTPQRYGELRGGLDGQSVRRQTAATNTSDELKQFIGTLYGVLHSKLQVLEQRNEVQIALIKEQTKIIKGQTDQIQAQALALEAQANTITGVQDQLHSLLARQGSGRSQRPERNERGRSRSPSQSPSQRRSRDRRGSSHQAVEPHFPQQPVGYPSWQLQHLQHAGVPHLPNQLHSALSSSSQPPQQQPSQLQVNDSFLAQALVNFQSTPSDPSNPPT